MSSILNSLSYLPLSSLPHIFLFLPHISIS